MLFLANFPCRRYPPAIMLAALIPESIFQAMPTWLLWVFLAVGLRFIALGADRLVSGAVHLAKVLGISTVIIGATVVSLGTTAPEAFVSVASAFRGKPGFALGNAVGSVICDTALIFGLCCLLSRLPLDRFVLYRQGVLKLLTVALLIVTMFGLAAASGGFGGVIFPRWIGLVYLALLAAYMVVSVRWTRRRPETLPEQAKVGPVEQHRLGSGLLNCLMLLEGLAIVYVSSDMLIGSATRLSAVYGVPQGILGVTVIAFGTSLPELVTALTSVIKGHPELMIGNIIGADILNVLFVVGASASAAPLNVEPSFFYLHLPVMAVSVGLMGIYIFTSGGSFKRWQGLPLLGVYVVYYSILIRTYYLP